MLNFILLSTELLNSLKTYVCHIKNMPIIDKAAVYFVLIVHLSNNKGCLLHHSHAGHYLLPQWTVSRTDFILVAQMAYKKD